MITTEALSTSIGEWSVDRVPLWPPPVEVAVPSQAFRLQHLENSSTASRPGRKGGEREEGREGERERRREGRREAEAVE
ncbi:unnamed protein product [Arctogadus glacialis]